VNWNPTYPYPEGGRAVEYKWADGSVDKITLMIEGQWSDSHWGDLLSAYPRGAITGWRYIDSVCETCAGQGHVWELRAGTEPDVYPCRDCRTTDVNTGATS
jgi:hypothetical protein